MDTGKVDLLLKTLKIGSIKMAAQQMNYTPSGLLYMINSIEEDLGFPILNRTHKGITLNERGKSMLPYFEELVSTDAYIRYLANEALKTNYDIRIGVVSCISSSILPSILKDFSERNKGGTVNVSVGLRDLVYALDRNEIDLAILPQYYASGYSYRHLLKTEHRAVLPSDLIPESQQSIPFEEFQQHPVIFPMQDTENLAYSLLTKRKISPHIRCKTFDATPLFSMVKNKLGVSFLTALFENECPEGVRMIPFSPPFEYNIGIVTSAQNEHNPIVQDFIACAQNYCRQHFPDDAPQ